MIDAGLIIGLTLIVGVVLVVLGLMVLWIDGVPPKDEPIEHGDGEP